MHISKITVTNYRGIKETRSINVEKFSSVVGKNDAGKTIILNSIASFLDVKTFPITLSDFNDIDIPIVFECTLNDDNLTEMLASKLKAKVKKADGLDEFINDFLFDGAVIYKREAIKVDKKFSGEFALMQDFEQEDIRGLYFMADEVLTSIIKKYDVNIPVEGKGRNSKIEKIKYIKDHFKTSERTTFWMEDDCKICSLFPEVEMFKADYGLEADTKFKTTSVSEIQDYFTREMAEDGTKLKTVEAEIVVEMKKEAKSVTNYMQDYASSLKAVEITPVISWKDAIKNVDVSFQFEGDEKFIPMSHKGTGYRRLFMVARFRYLAEKNKGHNIIYLIEEPETFLHPTAQQDLLNALKELSVDNQIIISTHSPVFAGATDVLGVVLCTKEVQSNYENADVENANDFLLKIVNELGIKPSYNLRDHHEKIVFVESTNDAKFYNIICEKLLANSLTHNPRILVLPFGGGSDIESFLNIDYFDHSGRKLFLIIDSDKQEDNFDKQQERANAFKNGKELGEALVIRKSCIENYYHPRAIEREYGLENNTFDFFADDDNARKVIKQIVNEKELINKNIKEKNNFKVFNSITEEEWKEVIEQDLLAFLQEILN